MPFKTSWRGQAADADKASLEERAKISYRVDLLTELLKNTADENRARRIRMRSFTDWSKRIV